MHVQRKKTGCASDYVFHSQEALTNKPKKRKQKKNKKKQKNKHVREGQKRRKKKLYISAFTLLQGRKREIYIMNKIYTHQKTYTQNKHDFFH